MFDNCGSETCTFIAKPKNGISCFHLQLNVEAGVANAL